MTRPPGVSTGHRKPAGAPRGSGAERDARSLLDSLDDPATTHDQRERVGLHLAYFGDPRSGVGVRSDGVPDIDWCPVPGGTVRLLLEAHASAEFPVRAFRMARHPVTWDQWNAFRHADDGYRDDAWWGKDLAARQVEREDRWTWGNHPVVLVSWHDAIAYARWLSHRRGEAIRLPNEWEWQWAAMSARARLPYPWGDWRAPTDEDRSPDGPANTQEAKIGRTIAVGMYPAGRSRQGIDDLTGNVGEWCRNDYRYPRTGASPVEEMRADRGGGWSALGRGTPVPRRRPNPSGTRRADLGFRLVCTSPVKTG